MVMVEGATTLEESKRRAWKASSCVSVSDQTGRRPTVGK
jgi:hypothetical protein